MEDKREICVKLLPVLKACYNTRDVINLEYEAKSETVIATLCFSGKISHVRINVEGDSCASMVRDIIRKLM